VQAGERADDPQPELVSVLRSQFRGIAVTLQRRARYSVHHEEPGAAWRGPGTDDPRNGMPLSARFDTMRPRVRRRGPTGRGYPAAVRATTIPRRPAVMIVVMLDCPKPTRAIVTSPPTCSPCDRSHADTATGSSHINPEPPLRAYWAPTSNTSLPLTPEHPAIIFNLD